MNARAYDVVIVGSGAGGGTAAQALAPLVGAGKRVLVLEQGPRFQDIDEIVATAWRWRESHPRGFGDRRRR